MELKTAVVSSNAFTHHAAQKTITAEASTLGRGPARLYDDACDVGYTLRNVKTNNLTRWYLEKDVYDREGDITKSVFKPCTESVRKNPQLAGYKMVVFND
jgi:hypothetical protein